MPDWQVIQADCRDAMADMDADSIDAIVTDPPYGLSFMGKGWDHAVPGEEFWTEALRVAKPGAHLLAFGGTRLYHRLTCAIEDAGWEVRDCLMWLYGSGFPKSHDVSKAIDKAAGEERKVVGSKVGRPGYSLNQCDKPGGVAMEGNVDNSLRNPDAECAITAPATDLARQWQGWGTALKPAWEPIILARKPLAGTVAANVTEHGTGALNIDGCRVGTTKEVPHSPHSRGCTSGYEGGWGDHHAGMSGKDANVGRWPANLILDAEAGAAVDGQAGQSSSPHSYVRSTASGNTERVYACPKRIGEPAGVVSVNYGDSGGPSRFFYCPKASKADRGPNNTHPTVKPHDLMRYLCRLITPPGGTVLDPFCGSGSTGKAAVAEGFDFVGIEMSDEYADIARDRIAAAASKAEHRQPELI